MKKLMLTFCAVFCSVSNSYALDLTVPEPYFSKIDEKGHYVNWQDFEYGSLAGVRWPIRINFDNGNLHNSIYSGLGWSIPLIDSKVVHHDAKHASVTLPCGRVFKFQSFGNPNEFQCLNMSQWSAKKEKHKFTMVSGNWNLVFYMGKIQSMKTPVGKAKWIYDEKGILKEISDGETIYFKFTNTKTLLQIYNGHKKKTIFYEKTPVKKFGKLYSDETLNKEGYLMTKAYIRKSKDRPEYLAVSPTYFTIQMKHVYTKKVHDISGICLKVKPIERSGSIGEIEIYGWDKSSGIVLISDDYNDSDPDEVFHRNQLKVDDIVWYHITFKGQKYNDYPKIFWVNGCKQDKQLMAPLSGQVKGYYHYDLSKGVLMSGSTRAFAYDTHTLYTRTNSTFTIEQLFKNPKLKNYQKVKSFVQYLDVDIDHKGLKKKKSTLTLYGEFFYNESGKRIKVCVGNQVYERKDNKLKYVGVYKKNEKVAKQLLEEIKTSEYYRRATEENISIQDIKDLLKDELGVVEK